MKSAAENGQRYNCTADTEESSLGVLIKINFDYNYNISGDAKYVQSKITRDYHLFPSELRRTNMVSVSGMIRWTNTCSSSKSPNGPEK